MNYYAASGFFNGLCGFFLVYYIYLRNRKNPLNRSFLYFGITTSGWSLIYGVWMMERDARMAELFVRFLMMFATLIPAAFFHFVSHLTQSYERHKKLCFLFYFLCALSSAACLTPAMIAGVHREMFFEFWPKRGFLLPTYVVYFGIVVS